MPDQKTCPQCGQTNRSTARFCSGCRYDFSETDASVPLAPAVPVQAASAQAVAPDSGRPPVKEFCPSCGKEIIPGAHFCRYCGGALSPAVVPGPPSSQTPGIVPAPESVSSRATTQPEPMAAISAVHTPAPPALEDKAAPTSQPAPAETASTHQQLTGPRSGRPWLFLFIGLTIGLTLGAGGLFSVQNWPGLGVLGNAPAAATPAATTTAPTATTAPTPPLESAPADSVPTVVLPTPTQSAPVAPDGSVDDTGATP